MHGETGCGGFGQRAHADDEEFTQLPASSAASVSVSCARALLSQDPATQVANGTSTMEVSANFIIRTGSKTTNNRRVYYFRCGQESPNEEQVWRTSSSSSP